MKKQEILKSLTEYGSVNRAANRLVTCLYNDDISQEQTIDIKNAFKAGAYFFYNALCQLPDELNNDEVATEILDNLSKELDQFIANIEKNNV